MTSQRTRRVHSTLRGIQENFFDHLQELRRRLFWSLGAFLFCALLSYSWSDRLLRILTAPIRSEVGQIYFFSPPDAFLVRLKVAFFAGLVMASPVIISQIWLFVSPGLTATEKKTVYPLIFLTSFLFLAGCLFAFAWVLPFALRFFMGFQTEFLQPQIYITHYVSFVSSLAVSFGLAFNLPVFIMAFSALGLVDARRLGRYRKHAFLLAFVAASVLTPPDVLSQILLGLSLVFLFEASLVGARFFDRR